MKSVQSFLARLAVGALGVLVAGSAWAWPDKPIEIVVGFAPGGGTDITARTLATFLGKALGGTVLVVNKPGASGAIGLAYVARAHADGYTLGMTNMPGLLTLPIERDAGFKSSDFTYIANLVRDPSAFSVTLDSTYKSVADLVAAAKKGPGSISYGSTGVGTDDHLAMVMFEALTGTKLLHVPFNGAGPLRNALMGKHVAVSGMNLGEAMPYSGQTVRILAQAGNQRSKLGPDVPSFKEQGVDLVFGSERGVVGPKGLPAEIEQKLALALRQVAENPEFQSQMKSQFTEMDYMPAAEWKKHLERADAGFRQMWAKKPWTD
jgi:tripartite-type tricarboxylate transporter receptor subunit TctC